MLAGEVEAPVVVEVSVGDHRADGESAFRAVDPPPAPADVEAVADQVPACSLDDAGRDGPAVCEGLVVAQVFVPGVQVAHAGVRAGSPTHGQAGGVGLGGGVTGLVQAPRGFPDVLQLSPGAALESYVLAGQIVVAIDVMLPRR